MKSTNVLILFVAIFLLVSCVGSPAWKASRKTPEEYSIQVVTHPRLTENLKFIGGFTLSIPSGFTNGQAQRLAKYEVYERNYTNVIVLFDFKVVNQSGAGIVIGKTTSYVGGQKGHALISIFEKEKMTQSPLLQ